MAEIKNRKTCAPARWHLEVLRQCVNASATYGVLVWSPPGLGPKSVARWLAFEWEEVAVSPFLRGDALAYNGPMTKLASVLVGRDDTIYLPSDDNVRWCRVRSVENWTADLQELLAARPTPLK